MSEYKVIKGGEDHYIERVKDGKRIADVTSDGIKPSAPAYYKIMDELESLVSGEEKTPDKPAKKGKPKSLKDSPMPEQDAHLGDLDPPFIEWLHANDPKEAEKRYAGRNIETYENLVG